MRIDAHVHIFPPETAGRREGLLERDLTFRTLYSNPKARTATERDLIEAMDGAGIDAAVLANIGWTSHDLCRDSNTFLLEAAGRHPGRLIPFCSVNPLSGEKAAQEIERCAALGARGVGELHPDTQGYDLGDSRLMAPIMEAAQRNGLVVLTHASEPVGHDYAGKGKTTPDVLYRFVTSFPESRIILAHWGGGLPFYALMPEVRKSLANVWFDTAASPFLYEQSIFEHAVNVIGTDRILFATDYPLIQPSRLLKQVEGSGLSTEAKEFILAGNAGRLLGL